MKSKEDIIQEAQECIIKNQLAEMERNAPAMKKIRDYYWEHIVTPNQSNAYYVPALTMTDEQKKRFAVLFNTLKQSKTDSTLAACSRKDSADTSPSPSKD